MTDQERKLMRATIQKGCPSVTGLKPEGGGVHADRSRGPSLVNRCPPLCVCLRRKKEGMLNNPLKGGNRHFKVAGPSTPFQIYDADKMKQIPSDVLESTR